jgi:hypothetical protein
MICDGRALADDQEKAKQSFEIAREYFDSSRYLDAIIELKKAYALKKHPLFLKYIADAYLAMNQAEPALKHYILYLRREPDAARR